MQKQQLRCYSHFIVGFGCEPIKPNFSNPGERLTEGEAKEVADRILKKDDAGKFMIAAFATLLKKAEGRPKDPERAFLPTDALNELGIDEVTETDGPNGSLLLDNVPENRQHVHDLVQSDAPIEPHKDEI